MPLTYSPISVSHNRGALPPAAPLPRTLQTLACRLQPLEYLEWCYNHLGPRFTVRPINMPPLVFLSDPKDIRAIVTAPLTVLHAGRGAAITAPLFGEGSFMLREEEDYLTVRNAITPAFHRRVVMQHTEMVAELADREMSSWPLDTAIQTRPRLCVLTMTVILRTVFGQDSPTMEALHKHMLRMLSVATSFVLQEPRLRHLPGWRATWQTFRTHRNEVDKLVADLIAQRRNSPGEHHDMLGMLLEVRRPDGSLLSDKELCDNIVSVVIAGHETTSSTLAWAIQLIAHHPSVQDRLVAELYKDGGEDYLTATLNEIMRLSPVFLFTAPRAVNQPIEIGGWTYHPPAHLLGCTYLMHNDPLLFREPREFRPERFLEPPSSGTWLPWGGGRKVCPGRHLALLELRTVLRSILSTRRLLPTSNTIERVRWRSALVSPHAESTVILQQQHLSSRVQ
jgi:cytochrome P450